MSSRPLFGMSSRHALQSLLNFHKHVLLDLKCELPPAAAAALFGQQHAYTGEGWVLNGIAGSGGGETHPQGNCTRNKTSCRHPWPVWPATYQARLHTCAAPGRKSRRPSRHRAWPASEGQSIITHTSKSLTIYHKRGTIKVPWGRNAKQLGEMALWD